MNKIKKLFLCTILTCAILGSSIPAKVYALKDAATTFSCNNWNITIDTLENANANTENKEHLNVGDSTFIKVSKNNTNHFIVIDAGTASSDAPAISELFEGTNYRLIPTVNSNKTTYTINHFVLTHSHGDHTKGLKYLSDNIAKDKTYLVIENLYVNTVYMNVEEKEKDKFSNILIGLLNDTNITIKNIVYFGAQGQDREDIHRSAIWDDLITKYGKKTIFTYRKSIQDISIGDSNCNLAILPAMQVFEKTGDAKAANNSSMSVVFYDGKATNNSATFKAIFPGDLVGNGLEVLLGKTKYRKYFSKVEDGVTYETVYYKVPHHGKRGDTYAYDKKTGKSDSLFFNSEATLLSKYVQPTYVIGTAWTSSDNGRGIAPLVSDQEYKLYSNLLTWLDTYTDITVPVATTKFGKF